MTTSNTISTLGIQLMSATNLQAEQTYLAQLNQQVGSGLQHDNLTDYSPLQATQLMSFQNAISQRQSYVGAMQTVNGQLQVYDQTMTDMEKIASQAQQLATQNPTLNPATTGEIQQQASAYLNQVTADLNQQVGDRYIYAGTRYSTQPVSLDAALNGTVTGTFAPVAANALPPYDSEYNASNAATATGSITYNANLPSGAANGAVEPPSTMQIYDTAGNTHTLTLNWSKTGSNAWSLVVSVAGGKSTSATSANYTATIPFTFNGSGSNAGTIASGGIASGNGSSNNYTVSASPPGAAGVSFVLGFPGDTAQTISLGFGTYDSSTSSLTQMADATDQVSVSKFTQNGSGGGVYDPKAWAQASVQIDSAFNVAYGVTSTQTGFQQLIAGMQLIQQAATSTDSATYQKDMTQAATLLSSGLTNIQSYHSKVAAATNAINEEQTTQNTDISNLQTQLSNIQQVDLSTVGTQLNIMQTQLQASYAATATLAQLSILKYL